MGNNIGERIKELRKIKKLTQTEFGKKLNVKEFREERNYTLRQLARISGVAKSTISKIENGRCSPSINTLEKIAIGLSVRITDLFESEYK